MTQKQTDTVQSITDQIKDMVGKFSGNGANVAATIETLHQNIEGTFNASKIANQGALDVASRQLELYQDTSKQLLSMFGKVEMTADQRAEVAKSAFESALAGSREVTEIINKTTEEVFAAARQRVTGNIGQFQKSMGSSSTTKE